MNHTEKLTKYTANFVDELVKCGLEHVVISPGSRSTPLAMMMCHHEGIKEWIIVDERSASYFALGMAKQTKNPVALLCTSGTAAANYYPAIIEASLNRVPLIVLTADRPHELRDIGASQAIDQIKIFGDYIKWFQEMPLPDATEEVLSFVRTTASRAMQIAKSGNSGPVHLNFPFREPLIPDFTIGELWNNESAEQYFSVSDGAKTLHNDQLTNIIQQIQSKRRGLIVCGPQEDEQLSIAISKLAKHWGLPILADPLSQIRAGAHNKDNLIENYDSLLRNAHIRKQLKPDFIIRFGAMPVSKFYSFFAEEHNQSLHFIVEPYEGYRQPTKQSTRFIYADPISFIEQIIDVSKQEVIDHDWLNLWLQLNKIGTRHVLHCHSELITEGEAVRDLLEVIPNDSILYVGNSMAVRDLDTFFMKTDKEIKLLANRGASGIEGLTSSALGAAATTNKQITLLIGDLSFYHDLNGLLAAKQYHLNMTILLMNNNGGGIFSFLPQATKNEQYFEKLFGTPLNIDFKHAISMYGGKYEMAENSYELKEKLKKSYHTKGVTVIEVQTDRKENMIWHRKLWQEIEDDLLGELAGGK